MLKSSSHHRASILERLGWQGYFASQVEEETLHRTPPARVTQVHRNSLHVLGEKIDTAIIYPTEGITVGDWVLLDGAHTKPVKLLERKSLIKRRGAGRDRSIQMIAANLDTAFIVTTCNRDFNIARLERYIALALDAGVSPVIVLGKADLCKDTTPFEKAAAAISSQVPVVVLNAKSGDPEEKLSKWCAAGQTVAFLGSSGVGKSTLVNALTGLSVQTRAVRVTDARGRHTTTSRHLHLTKTGCAVIDTPGMRELQLADAVQGIQDLFSDFHALAASCKFSDCTHQVEPGCAIRSALEAGTIEKDRLTRWLKLIAEEQENTTALSQRKIRHKKSRAKRFRK